MRITVHPQLQAELNALAERGFREERSIGTILGRVQILFVDEALKQAEAHWKLMPPADDGVSVPLDLRCIDPDDGLVTLIATVRGDVLYLLSAQRGSRKGRAQAIEDAAQRMRDLSWAQPE